MREPRMALLRRRFTFLTAQNMVTSIGVLLRLDRKELPKLLIPIRNSNRSQQLYLPPDVSRNRNAGKLATEKRCLFGISFTRSEEHTSELQSRGQLVCRLLLEKKN